MKNILIISLLVSFVGCKKPALELNICTENEDCPFLNFQGSVGWLHFHWKESHGTAFLLNKVGARFFIDTVPVVCNPTDTCVTRDYVIDGLLIIQRCMYHKREKGNWLIY